MRASPSQTVNLVEIFSSVQGEGPHLGQSTLFVRFGECDLRCRWCDSPHTWLAARECRLELRRGSGQHRVVPNPVAIEDVLAACQALEVEAHRFVSLTGGEPLLQPEAVLALARGLSGRGPRILLETHGAASEALEQVVGAIDVVSMDWKLASDVRRASDPRRGAAPPFHAAHEAFLRVARRAPEVVVKLVLTPASNDAEIDEAAARIAKVDPAVTVVLQPVTPFGAVREAPTPARLLEVFLRLSRGLSDVRMIPQTHKQIGVP
jgi:organic radical activating enzyme